MSFRPCTFKAVLTAATVALFIAGCGCVCGGGDGGGSGSAPAPAAIGKDPVANASVRPGASPFIAFVDLLWILGDPSKYWHGFPSLAASSLALAAGNLYPIGQHAVSITHDGLLLLFNNGLGSLNQPAGAPAGESRSYSAVSAYAIDAASRSAQEAWRFDNGQSILSDICSSAYEAAAGASVLVSYAVADGRTHARLVGLDDDRGVVFDFEYATTGCDTSWNAKPIALEALHLE